MSREQQPNHDTQMVIYHGCPSPRKLEKCHEYAPSFVHGAEWIPEKMTPHDVPYILDNGAYQAHMHDEEWDREAFVAMLDDLEKMPREPDFVILPDIHQKSYESIVRSGYWAQPLAERGLDFYLPVQNGMPVEQSVRAGIDIGASGIFVGGSRGYKRKYAGQYVITAHDYGLKCHIGKPGKRLTWARDLGADSVDTTSIVRNEYWDRLEKLEATPRTEEATLTDGGWDE